MKVTIDGILNTAIDMKNKKNIHEESSKDDKQKVKSDSIEIRSRVASRLGIIQNELKILQSSLTKNQVIEEGIIQLKEDFENGGGKTDAILNQIRFEKKDVLTDFFGKDINYESILSANEMVKKLIDKDIVDLKALQIEIENIVASNLVDSDNAGMVWEIEHSLSNIDFSSLSNISDLKPDAVMGLIK